MIRPLAFFVLALAAFAPAGFAEEEREVGFAERHEEGLKWANFVALAAGLGYLIGKNAGPFFDARSRKIRRAIIEASDARKEAEAHAAEVDRRLANLETEIAALRAESRKEAQEETERMARQTEVEIAKIQAHAEQEIAAAGKAARIELRRYSAHLAVGLAERKIRARMTPAAEDALVERFVRDLKHPSPDARTS